jgi:hypothetical protein
MVKSRAVKSQAKPRYHHVIAGGVAGFCEYLFRQPFDMYKTVQQTDFKHRIPLTRGIVASLVGAVTRNSLLFSTYQSVRQDTGSVFLGGIASGFANGMMFQASDVIKVKQQTRVSHESVLMIIREIVRKQGFRGLTQGLPVTLARECVACPIYYGLYEACREWLKDPEDTVMDVRATLIAGSITGLVSFTATHPIDVLKSNQQLTDRDSLWTTACRVCRTSGWWYRGIVPVWISIVPATAICFLGYEVAISKLDGM